MTRDAINRARKRRARELGERYYQPVMPCHYGHHSPRYASDGHCVACRQLRYSAIIEDTSK